MEIIGSEKITTLPDWSKQLADLTKTAWTGANGVCFFPYQPLTEAEFWRTEVAKTWKNGDLRSWVMVIEDQIVAHAALVRKGKGWELGRWVSRNEAPRLAVTNLCLAALKTVSSEALIRVECTQAHTTSQAICRRLGWRFAGIDVLPINNGVEWDIIYFDNLPEPDFYPRPGLIANPCGQNISAKRIEPARLREIRETLSTERGGSLPPTKFHVLEELKPVVEQIIDCNL